VKTYRLLQTLPITPPTSHLPSVSSASMAANDYYQSSSQRYQAFDPSATSDPSPYAYRSYYGSNNRSEPSVAPSYHSTDPYQHESMVSAFPSNKPSYGIASLDETPAKSNARLQTSQTEWPSTQNTAYPPSPESQQPHPALIPSPTKSKRRKKKKGGFFSGKVPWFVYFISLVQVSVFVVEIIKNCKSCQGRGHVQRLTCHSNNHWFTHHGTSIFQPYDRPFNICANQHGSSLRAVHENHILS